MPTLRGLIFAATGGESKILLLLLSGVVVLVLVSIAWQSSMEVGLAFALVGGLLTGYHAYLPDCMILLMTFVLVLEHSRFVPLRGAIALTITPPVLFCLMLGSPWNAVVPISLLITMAIAAIRPSGPQSTAEPKRRFCANEAPELKTGGMPEPRPTSQLR